jgi:hypothetical protein
MGCPSKLVSIGSGWPPGDFEEPSSAPTILSFYILSPIHLPHSPSPGIRMTYLRGYTLSCGKKVLKAQEVKVAGKR